MKRIRKADFIVPYLHFIENGNPWQHGYFHSFETCANDLIKEFWDRHKWDSYKFTLLYIEWKKGTKYLGSSEITRKGRKYIVGEIKQPVIESKPSWKPKIYRYANDNNTGI